MLRYVFANETVKFVIAQNDKGAFAIIYIERISPHARGANAFCQRAQPYFYILYTTPGMRGTYEYEVVFVKRKIVFKIQNQVLSVNPVASSRHHSHGQSKQEHSKGAEEVLLHDIIYKAAVPHLWASF